MNDILSLKRAALVILLLVSSGTVCFSQSRKSDFAYKMQVKKAGMVKPVCTFVLRNTGSEALPAAGWAIYFNSIKDPKIEEGDTSFYQVSHINGDLYRLHPGKKFIPLLPGKQMSIDIYQQFLKNVSDFPAGFYLVWDKNPSKGYPIKNTDPGFTSLIPEEQQISQQIFEQNEIVLSNRSLSSVKIFPTPLKYSEKGFTYKMKGGVGIISDPAFHNEATLLASDLLTLFGLKSPVLPSGSGPAIVLKKMPMAADAYKLEIDKERVVISASSSTGIFYGIQSLKTLLPPDSWKGKHSSLDVPAVAAEDAPRFGHRAIMLDVARNFQTKQQVLKVIDLMALYKLNILHFHLIDDEGWRVEVKDLPELTQVGAVRGHRTNSSDYLPPSHGSGADINKLPGSGFYSREDFIEILKYANERHIQVIPEIETPGHARAAIKAMEARYRRLMKTGFKAEAEKYLLTDLSDKSVYKSVQGWNDNVINVALPSVYTFMEKVIGEFVRMYKEAGAPLVTIHMGGDEVPAGVWENSGAVSKLTSTDKSVKGPEDLWKYFFTRVNSILSSYNLQMSGWEEIGLRKVTEGGKKRMVVDTSMVKYNFRTDVWNNLIGTGAEDLAYRLANAGYKVVLSNVTNMYFDFASDQSFKEPGMYWGGYVGAEKPFYFIPYNYFRNFKEDDLGNPVDPSVFEEKERLTEAGRANIIGLQAALWSETITTPQRLEYMLLPKLLSLAERAWAADPAWATDPDPAVSEKLYRLAWSDFLTNLWDRELPRLDYYHRGFSYRIPAPGVILKNGRVLANAESPKLTIRYTIDGTEPNAGSPLYKDGVSSKGTILFKAFNAAGRSGNTVKIINK
ncbi:hexosaminidase [Arcticibacter tournemirensis]|uniref:beta-N-acetylhexosaminidase n=1 Tax=Arcticibacter tournemirensis TaxID=699437 RepID=A0A5M9HDV1_9SPHI|nr:family 20 glycosylhydrolase [Arcticibacter tournemirensis]KAA8484950.1 family 20 glycosylhydrolase [Arcticibacter tournemirensis]TQM50609.1 hexosaminidase [Arcticibacter tournemirensis]